MPKVDLNLLRRKGELEVDEDLEPDDPLWAESGVTLDDPLQVRLEVQDLDGDVQIHGRLSGSLAMECRRCLEGVTVPIDEPVDWLFRGDLDPVEAIDQEVYTIPSRARTLDLGEPIREHLILSVPEYPVCRAACRGLCPVCGTNLNESVCECDLSEPDDRWAPLRELDQD